MSFLSNFFNQNKTLTMADVYNSFTEKAREIIDHNSEIREEQTQVIKDAEEILNVAESEIEEAQKFISKFTQ